MRIYYSPLKTLSILYDFAFDGGAVGTFRSGQSLPAGLNVHLTITGITTLDNGGLGCDVSIGYDSDPTFFWAGSAPGNIPPFVDAYDTILRTTNEEIIFTLALNPLTAGQLMMQFSYFDFKV